MLVLRAMHGNGEEHYALIGIGDPLVGTVMLYPPSAAPERNRVTSSIWRFGNSSPGAARAAPRMAKVRARKNFIFAYVVSWVGIG